MLPLMAPCYPKWVCCACNEWANLGPLDSDRWCIERLGWDVPNIRHNEEAKTNLYDGKLMISNEILSASYVVEHVFYL